MTLAVLVIEAIDLIFYYIIKVYIVFVILAIVFYLIVPMTVLVVNVMVVREVCRRASNDATTSLGLQQHQQSTTFNSAVPTVMLVTSSFVYLLLSGIMFISYILYYMLVIIPEFNSYVFRFFIVAPKFVYTYDFYVYLITGRQFRSELHKLFCSCYSSSSSAAADAANVDVRAVGRGQADTNV